MNEKKIALIYGGQSGEFEVSCRSAHFLWEALSLSYDVLLIAIAKNGKWYWQTEKSIVQGTLLILEERLVSLTPGVGFFCEGDFLLVDKVFPMVHGSYGEDGRLQALLDMVGLPYVGSSFLSSAVCMDKALLKTLWEKQNIPTLPFLTVSFRDLDSFKDSVWQSKLKSLSPYPYIVKPAGTGSSLGISKVSSFEELKDALEKALSWNDLALIEPFGSFRELECAVVEKDCGIHVFPMGEITFSGVDFYDYNTKYEGFHSVQFQIPALLEERQEALIRQMAQQAYTVGRCQGFARVDFFIDKTNPDKIYVNEINTLPGFTKISLFPQMCLAGGLSLRELGKLLVESD